MFSNPLHTTHDVLAQHSENRSTLASVTRQVTPMVVAASSLAQTARELQHMAAAQNKNATLSAPNSPTVRAGDLAKSLKVAKDALKAFASKANGLVGELNHFANHQEGLFRGNMSMVPQKDKVWWCARQIESLTGKSEKLAVKHAPSVSAAVNTVQRVSVYFGRSVHSDLPSQVRALQR